MIIRWVYQGRPTSPGAMEGPTLASMGDQLWQRGTNYGAMNDLAGPTKVTQVVRGDHLQQP